MFGRIQFCVLLIFILVIVEFECKKVKRRSAKNKDDGKSSLAFVFDVTGSMYNDLRQLREGAEMILNTALKESDVIADFVFVPFHDPAVGPVTVTRKKDIFKKALNNVNVHGGGDCPEKSLTGIHLALNVSRPRSFLYVFTDATAADHRIVGKVLDTIQRKQSQVVFILTGHCNDLDRPSYKVYQQVAAASSGQIFNLNKASVHKMLEFVKSSIKGRTVNLASVSNPAGYNYSQGIPVDSTLGEVTVSVSGAKPKITVVDPNGEQLTGPPKLITTLDLSEIMVVKVMQPEPGNWTITVGSEEDYSVKVVGLSNLTFNHGFSVEKPNSMKETSYRPLRGTYNHLLISLTQTNVTANISYAEILTLDGRTLFELPLKLVDKKNQVYLAEPFIPPEDFFYIAINGRDQYHQDLRRIGATAIQAKLPDVPYLTAPRKIEAHSHTRVVLTCNVESLVPVTAMWTKDATNIQEPTSSLQTTSIDYIIEDMREEHVGSYTCVAHNVAGVSKAITHLTLIVDPPQVTIQPANKTVEIGDNITISCTVHSEALLLENRLVFNGTFKNYSYAIDLNKEPSLEGVYVYNKTIQISEKETGVYSCVAANRGGKTNQSTHISIIAKPTAQILGPHTLTKHINTDFQLVCTVENADNIVWSSPNGTIVKRREVKGIYNDVLDVKNVTEDGGWTCAALRGSLEGSDTVNVTVLIKPIVSIIGSRNITIVNGTVIEVTCQVIARPPPRILWHKETEDFLDNTITQIKPNIYRSVLTLNSSAESVQNTYFCFGENSEGIHQDSVSVNVRRKMTLVQGFEDESVQLYYQLELHCNIDSHPPPHLRWYHNGTELLPNKNVNFNENNSTVYLKRIDFSDLGSYVCEADNRYEKMYVNGTVTVHGLASPKISKEPGHQTTQVGRSTIITCRVLQGNPEPIISWQYKSTTSKDYTATPQGVIKDDDDNKLVITNTSAEHNGIYKCTATNVIGQDSYEVNLSVQFPPTIRDALEKAAPKEIKLGEVVKFSCEAVGSPLPIIVWTKDEKPLVVKDNIFLTNRSEIVIKNVTVYDSGTYTCTATSAIGSTRRNYTLIVYDPPKLSPITSEPILEVLEGQLVNLPCSAQGYPAPAVKWIQNGKPISGDRKYIDEFGLRFVANITDFGEYSCIATNLYGSTSVNYTILVWIPPYIAPPLHVVKEVTFGTKALIQCDVVGFPLPSISWQFGDEILTENTTDLSFNDIGNVYIPNATYKHEGVYVCIAENNGGVAQQTTYLKIIDPPKILEENYTGSYLATDMDTVLTIPCRASGKPKPYVMWSKDEFYLDKDPRYAIDIDGTLTIKSPSEDMSGNYTCTAKSSIGTFNKTVLVEIYSIPKHVQSEESQTTVTVVEGTDAVIECPVKAQSIKWYKNAKLISTGSLVIPNISRYNASTYACVATNAVGSAYSKVQVIVEWEPKFVMNQSDNVEVIRDDDAYLDCSVDAKPKARMKWVYNSKQLVFEDGEQLKLINVQPHNAGKYKCIVNNSHGTIIKEFNLSVLVPPFISEFDMLDVQLKEGVNATLECDAKGIPTPNITWTYNNSNWHVHNSSLSSTNITPHSEGLYRCDAINKAGATHIVYRLSIVAGAQVEDVVVYNEGKGVTVENSVELVKGSNTRIACKATGNPVPSIQWIKQGRVISENEYDINYTDLMLYNVQEVDAGVYICVVDNEGGSDERRIRFDVLEPPKIFQTLFQNSNTTNQEVNLEVISGQSFNLHCHPYGNPIPEVYWFKNGVPLKLFDNTMVTDDFGEVIVVKKAKEDQSGNYTCVARNKVGNTSVVYLVDVLVPPPTPKESTKKVKANFGKRLVLSCPVVGSPVPNVMWIKHPYTEITADKRVFLTEDNFNLVINKSEVTDSGKYSCIMTNKVGTTEVVFDVTILKAPSIAGKVGTNMIEEHIVPLKRSIVLKCEADGYPLPRIAWLKDTQALSDSLSNIHQVLGNSLLAIWSVNVKDAGQYICVVDNDAGSAHLRYNVKLLAPGKWSSWTQWSYCNVTCGLGYQLRSRTCQYIDDDNNVIDNSTMSDRIILDVSACKGPITDRRKCHMPPCDLEESKPRWSAWSRWSECSASCGVGTQARTRRCKTRARCEGDNVQIRKCTGLPPCNSDSSGHSDNDVFDSQEDTSDVNSYLPEMTFETQPEVINSHFSPDVEDFYRTKGSQSPSTVFYDVIVTENLDHSERGPCDPGYRYNLSTNTCDDVDECTVETNQCHSTQVCVNTEGAYRCSCPPGYLSLGAGQRCLDINECELETDGCSHSCVNTAGGYVCACPRHLRLHVDRHHCVTPALYRKPIEDSELDYLSTTVDFPTKYTKTIRNT